MCESFYLFFIDCGFAASVDHGSIDFTNANTTYGQSVPVTCDTGYKLTGGSSVECLIDGTWSKLTTCEIIGLEFAFNV